MITFTQGNLLDADAEALVNTVNTVGVMGKGIALMFKEAFPENSKIYEAACKTRNVHLGQMLVTERKDRWVVRNGLSISPPRAIRRFPSKMEWIESGLEDLRRIVVEKGIKSVALPPLGSGNGGLNWNEVKPLIETALRDIPGVNFIVYEPTSKYQNVAKRTGVEKLTPSRALVAELVRRYGILGMECTLLEIQKLAYFLERAIIDMGLKNELDLRFQAARYGPYAPRLTHLLDGLDGSYLHCEKRLADAEPFDTIWFDEGKRDKVAAYLTTADAKPYRAPLEATATFIDGFQSPLGMELLATVDWLLHASGVRPSVPVVREALGAWPGGDRSGERKQRIFDDRLIGLALERLVPAAIAER